MIVSLLQINSLIKYFINCGNLGLFGHWDHIYCHDNDLIRGQKLLAHTLKPHQEPLIYKY